MIAESSLNTVGMRTFGGGLRVLNLANQKKWKVSLKKLPATPQTPYLTQAQAYALCSWKRATTSHKCRNPSILGLPVAKTETTRVIAGSWEMCDAITTLAKSCTNSICFPILLFSVTRNFSFLKCNFNPIPFFSCILLHCFMSVLQSHMIPITLSHYISVVPGLQKKRSVELFKTVVILHF